ncbi:MAG TPA: glycosyltransferase family 4 protein [Methylomirabilota bacterium]|nr:glycosyltransferase family 4 protein [Methylomirabilota bacterium]
MAARVHERRAPPMKVALVNEYFPPHAPGGAEWSVAALGRALAARGAEGVVITPNRGAPASETREGVRVRRFPFPLKRPPGRSVAPQKVLTNPLFHLYAGWQLARLARAEGVDVLHVQNKHMLVAGVLARALTGRPVVLTIRDGSLIDAAPVCLHHHDRRPPDCGVRKLWRECSVEYYEGWMRGRRGRLRTQLAFLYGWLDACSKQRFLSRVDAVVGVSDGILGIYRRSGLLAGVRRVETVYTIPPLGVPSSEADGAAARARHDLVGRVVLFVGKLSPGKGAADFLAAGARVHATHPDALFVLVGEGSVPVPSAPWVRSLGSLPNPDVLALYAGAAVVAVPSVIPDALSRVVLEAMAARRAVVGTAVGGSPELIVDGESGLLVPRADPGALAAAIARLLDDPALATRLGAAAQARVRTRFAPDASLDRLLALYAAVRAA